MNEKNRILNGKTIGCQFCSGRIIKFGKTGAGNDRFRCLSCRKTFVYKKKPVVCFSDFVEFAQLITGMVNRKKIIQEKKISRKTLSKKFKPFFDNPLTVEDVWKIIPPKIAAGKNPWVYGVDGKWLKRNGIIILHRDLTNKENLFWSFHRSESFEALNEDLAKLSKLISQYGGNYPVGAVSDWKRAIVNSIHSHFGLIPHQRCLSHILRLAKKLLPQNSPFEATLKLRRIALDLKNISSNLEKEQWKERIIQWKKQYGYLLKEKTIGLPENKRKWWYTHGNLRRGYRLLTYDQEPLFVYLTNTLIPKSNNSLEAVNGQLDKRLSNHRGMKLSQQISFIFWYLTFGSGRNNMLNLKKLWVHWRRSFLP